MSNSGRISFSEYRDKYIRLITSEKLMFIYVVSCMILIPLAELLGESVGLMYFFSAYVISIYSIAGIIICSIDLFFNIRGRHWSDFFFISLSVFMFLSIIFSSNMGIFQEDLPEFVELPEYLVAYYCMMYAAFRISSPRYRKICLGSFIGISLLHGIVGILQTYGFKITPVTWKETTYEVYGLTQNTNFFGGLSVLFVCCCAGVVIFSSKKTVRIISCIALLIAVYCSLNSMARLAWLGVIAFFIFFLVSVMIMKKKNRLENNYNKYMKMYLLTLAVSAVAVIVSVINPNTFGLLQYRLFKVSEELETGGFNELGSGRGLIWKYCLSSIPRHWVSGVGLNNIPQCYLENPNWHEGEYVARHAHNIYLHVLTTQGVFAFVNYMSLLVISAAEAIRRILSTRDEEERAITWILLGMFVGHCVASFLNCRICYVEVYFYIVIGLMNPIVNDTSVGRPAGSKTTQK